MLNQFKTFFTGRFLGKVAVKQILKVPPHIAFVDTLPGERLISPKQAITKKLPGSVVTYLSCGAVINNQSNKRSLLSVRVKKICR